jgi:AcrR family transcriptional regulator
MSPRPDVSEERKTQILDAAEEVFARKGFDEARMEDIAERTGLSKGTLYLYFKSKEKLISGILDRIFQRELQQLENLEQSQLSATEEFNQLADQVTRDVVAMLRLVPIVYGFLALTFRNKHVQRTLQAYSNRYIDIFTPVIQRGIDSGEFRRVEAREVAIASNAIVEGTILLWVYNHESIDPARHIRSGMKILLEGMQARP